MRSNPFIATFLDKLNAAGVQCNMMWSGKRPLTKKGDDINFVAFVGAGFAPSVSTAIILDYGPRDGFGIYTDSLANDFDKMVAAIAKPRDAAAAPNPMEAALREIAENGPDEEPEAEDYDDTESAYSNGLEVEAWRLAAIAHKGLVAAAAAAPAPADDKCFDLLCRSLDAWEGEEDSVKEEHADLIEELNAYVDAHRPDSEAALRSYVAKVDSETAEFQRRREAVFDTLTPEQKLGKI